MHPQRHSPELIDWVGANKPGTNWMPLTAVFRIGDGWCAALTYVTAPDQDVMLSGVAFFPEGQETYLGPVLRHVEEHGGGALEITTRKMLGSKIRVNDTLPAHGLTARALHDFNLGEFEVEARRQIRSSGALTFFMNDPDRAAFRAIDRRPGRRGRQHIFYAEVAAAYVKELAESATPTKTLAAKLHVSASQLRNMLGEARRRELLTDSPKGRAGGALTPKARDILAEAEGN